MKMDHAIQEAVEIGRANKRTLELVQNWCAHITVEQVGGVGLVEIQTGLPIGMRGFNCAYAKDRGMAAMVLEAVAIHFYDLNCVGCANRHPLRLPNLAELVAKRDERRARAEVHAEQERTELRADVARRANRRAELARDGDAGRRSILNRIDELDADPTPDRALLLLENVRTVPERFDGAIQEALFALIDAGGLRAHTALEALSSVAKGSKQLADAALRMLASREAPRLAAEALGDGIRTASIEDVKSALPAIFELAAPMRDIGQMQPDSFPVPLLAAWGAAPSAVREYMDLLLRSDNKHSRILGCRSATALLKQYPQVGTEFTQLALQSVGRPDDPYSPGAAADAVATFLGAALRERFDDVDVLLQKNWQLASEEERATIVGAYLSILDKRDEQASTSADTEEKSFKRVLEIISARKVDASFIAVTEFLRYDARAHLGFVERHAEILLGATALLIEDLKERYSPLLDPRPTQLKALEDDTRRGYIRSAVDKLMDLVGLAGAARPDLAGRLVIATFQNLTESQKELRAALTQCLGEIGRSRDGLALVLPAIYSAMMASESLVRAAGASAYGALADDAADDLPQLMHETFLLLLQDSFVVVHQAAVHVLRGTRLPREVGKQALGVVWALIDAYAKSDNHSSFLEECIEVFLRLTHGAIAARGRSRLNSILLGMRPYLAARLLTSNADSLSGVPEYADVVVWALRSDEARDSDQDDLLEVLDRFSASDLERLASELTALAIDAHPGPSGAIDRLVDVATRVAGWEVGIQIARAPLSRLRDVPRDRALRQIVEVRLIAAQIEGQIAKGSVAEAATLAATWRGASSTLQAEHPGVLERWPLLRAFEARLEAFSSLERASAGNANIEEIARTIANVNTVAARLGPTPAGGAYAAYGRLLGAALHLLKWADAVRSAEQDADRYLRAAKQACKDIGAALDKDKAPSCPATIATAIRTFTMITELDAIQIALAAALEVSLPLPFHEEAPASSSADARHKTETAAPCVVFVSFTVDGIALSDPHAITPDELHDLDVTVKVSRWPSGARLFLDALTVEPQPGVCELPKFTFDRPQTSAPHEIHQGGRMLVRVGQAIAARPLEFVYRAYFLPHQPNLGVVVEGERRVRVRSHDPARNPVSGYRQVDLKLLEIRDGLRSFLGVRDDERDAFLLLLAGLGQMAGEALQDKTLPGKFSEADFQLRVREKLRANARIGSELQEHAHVAGGITDLSFRGIPIELKVEPNTYVEVDRVEGYSQQAAQYAAGSDRRLAILCVLDCAAKTSAPGSVANDIALRLVSPPGKAAGIPLLLGVVIVRGNLPRPSDLSK
jgi:hypothetical protein